MIALAQIKATHAQAPLAAADAQIQGLIQQLQALERVQKNVAFQDDEAQLALKFQSWRETQQQVVHAARKLKLEEKKHLQTAAAHAQARVEVLNKMYERLLLDRKKKRARAEEGFS